MLRVVVWINLLLILLHNMIATLVSMFLCVDLVAFGRPLAPPPPERRPPPNFVERPPFGFDQFGRPLFTPPASAPPPMWEPR